MHAFHTMSSLLCSHNFVHCSILFLYHIDIVKQRQHKRNIWRKMLTRIKSTSWEFCGVLVVGLCDDYFQKTLAFSLETTVKLHCWTAYIRCMTALITLSYFPVWAELLMWFFWNLKWSVFARNFLLPILVIIVYFLPISFL